MRIASSVAGSTQGKDTPLSWQALIGEGASSLGGNRRFIELGAKLDSTDKRFTTRLALFRAVKTGDATYNLYRIAG